MPYLPIERRKRGQKGQINACIVHEQIVIKSDKLLDLIKIQHTLNTTL